jgi:hypothetical protein
MNTFFKYIKNKNILFFIISALSFFVFCKTEPIYYSDSVGYISMSLIRSIGYSIFVNFFQSLFGSYGISILTFVQYFLGLFSCFFLIKSIKQTLNLNYWFLVVLLGVIISPLSYELKVSRSILSEGLAYPLFLLTTANLIIAFLKNKINNFYYAVLLTIILILVRGQFLFFTPILILVFVSIKRKKFSGKSILILLFLLAIPFLTILTDKFYHKIMHNAFVSTPWTGIQINTMPYFVSDKNDYKLFKTNLHKEYFRFNYENLESKKLLLNQFPVDKDKIDFFYKNYTIMCNETLSKDSYKFFDEKLTEDQKTILIDKLNNEMFFPLLINNLRKWSDIYSRNIIKGLGTFHIFIAYCIVFIVCLLLYIKNDKHHLKFVVLCLLIMFGNVFIVSIAEPATNRYLFYGNWILISFCLLLLNESTKEVK